MTTDIRKVKCYGCGALVDDIEGQPHEYIGATQGCWNVYGQILAKEYGEYSYPELTHRLTVDTYAIQHPGRPSRKSIQSVNIHLISLCLIFKKGFDGRTATQKMSEVLANEPNFKWLEPPVPNGQLTVIDIVIAKEKAEHERKVNEWAKDVWGHWYLRHQEKIDSLTRI
jgi:Family of unknown function (DUF5946)